MILTSLIRLMFPVRSSLILFMMGMRNSVASLRFSTAIRKHLECPLYRQNPLPFNSVPSMVLQFFNHALINLNFLPFLWIVTSLVSWLDISQSTAVLGLMCKCFLICSWGKGAIELSTFLILKSLNVTNELECIKPLNCPTFSFPKR